MIYVRPKIAPRRIGATPALRRAALCALIGLVSVTVGARLPYISSRSIWYDEASSWQTASFALKELPRSLRLNVHLPLYYVVLKGWMALFGESPVALRSLSIVFGAITVVATFFFASELYLISQLRPSRKTGKATDALAFASMAALTVALSAYQVNACIEVRMYSLGTALTALSSWALLRAMRNADGWRSWAFFNVSGALLLYCHPYALFTVLSQLGFTLLVIGDRAARRMYRRAAWLARRVALSGIVLAVAFTPGMMLLAGQHNRVHRDYWIMPLNVQMLASTLVQFVLPVYIDFRQAPYAESLMVFAGLAGALAITASRGRRGDWFLLVAGLSPLLFAAVVSLKTPIWEGRYFRFAHVFLCVVLVSAVWKMTRRATSWRVAALSALCGALCASTALFWALRDIPGRTGMRGAIAKILPQSRPEEVLIAESYIHYFPAKYYAPDGVTVKLLEGASREFWGGHLIRPGDLITQDAVARQLKQGIWFISHEPVTSNTMYQRYPALRHVIVSHTFTVDYDIGVPPWTVHIAHCVSGVSDVPGHGATESPSNFAVNALENRRQ